MSQISELEWPYAFLKLVEGYEDELVSRLGQPLNNYEVNFFISFVIGNLLHERDSREIINNFHFFSLLHVMNKYRKKDDPSLRNIIRGQLESEGTGSDHEIQHLAPSYIKSLVKKQRSERYEEYHSAELSWKNCDDREAGTYFYKLLWTVYGHVSGKADIFAAQNGSKYEGTPDKVLTLADIYHQCITGTDYLWKQREEAWDFMFKKLVRFKDKYGHCNVRPKMGRFGDLTVWVLEQRDNRNKGIISSRRFELLDEIGFEW